MATIGERERKAAHNQALMREVNERIVELTARRDGQVPREHNQDLGERSWDKVLFNVVNVKNKTRKAARYYEHNREAVIARVSARQRRMPKTAERGYGARHQHLRKRWRRQVEAGGVECARCGKFHRSRRTLGSRSRRHRPLGLPRAGAPKLQPRHSFEADSAIFARVVTRIRP